MSFYLRVFIGGISMLVFLGSGEWVGWGSGMVIILKIGNFWFSYYLMLGYLIW